MHGSVSSALYWAETNLVKSDNLGRTQRRTGTSLVYRWSKVQQWNTVMDKIMWLYNLTRYANDVKVMAGMRTRKGIYPSWRILRLVAIVPFESISNCQTPGKGACRNDSRWAPGSCICHGPPENEMYSTAWFKLFHGKVLGTNTQATFRCSGTQCFRIPFKS